MTHEPVLLIFDVDGTLCHTGGLGRVAFDSAFLELYGIEDAADGVRPHGRTDQWIFREIVRLQNIELVDFQSQYLTFIECYETHFERLIKTWDKAYLFTGVMTLLEKLDAESNIYLALGTGNVDHVAFMKLGKLGIDHFFPIGGFGSDSENRTEILKIAHLRSNQHYGITFMKENCWVIGDTHLDIINGRESGAQTIAVATGGSDIKELKLYNPTALFEDFNDWKRFFDIILNFNEV